jgi:hypothetical protein
MHVRVSEKKDSQKESEREREREREREILPSICPYNHMSHDREAEGND